MSQASRFAVHDSAADQPKTQDPSRQPRVLSLESSSAVQPPAVSGVVLAGGVSARMGRDKRFLDLHGVTLLEHVLARLRPIVGELIVVTRGADPLPGLDARMVTDRYPGTGVLAGVHAGLIAARNEWAYVVAGDMPLLNQELLLAMAPLADGFDRCGGAAVAPVAGAPAWALPF